MYNREVKKSLMYLSGEDFYLYSYALLVILDSLSCTNGKLFKDYRKLAFMIEFVKDERLVQIIQQTVNGKLNPIDKEYLFSSYSVGLSRRSEILKLLFTLEKRKLVILNKGNAPSIINVTLNKNEIPDDFFDKKLFLHEYSNVKKFCSQIQRLSTLKLETFLEKVYKNNGITTWVL